MKKHKCEMCGKAVVSLHDHHVIPWNFSQDDSESNIMRLCPSCHKRADNRFLNFVVYGELCLGKSKDTVRRAVRRYNRKYLKKKMLFCVKLLKDTFYTEYLRYNTRTGHTEIGYVWQHRPHEYSDRRTTSRNQLLKAASVKGQTTLLGGV